MATVWAVSDLHASARDNASRLDELRPQDPADWLIVAGDVAENMDLTCRVLASLAARYARVIWTPGNHELFARSQDRFRGRERYAELVRRLRALGVLTPEDPYPVFDGVTIVPLFTLYDYSFRAPGLTVEEALAAARERNVVLLDDVAIAPFVDIRAWCWDRLAYSVRRLSRLEGPTILVNHWPLDQAPTRALRWPDIGLWCGTRHTRQWPQRFNARAVVYGHLHLPGVTEVDGIPHVEVSLGYPREWRARELRGHQPAWPVPVLGDAAPRPGEEAP